MRRSRGNSTPGQVDRVLRGRRPALGTARACASAAWCGSRRGRAAPRSRCRTSRRRRRRRAGGSRGGQRQMRAGRHPVGTPGVRPGYPPRARWIASRSACGVTPSSLSACVSIAERSASASIRSPASGVLAPRAWATSRARSASAGASRGGRFRHLGRSALREHRRAQEVGRAAEQRQHAGGARVALDQQREQQVLGDRRRRSVEAHRLARRALERAARPRAERRSRRRLVVAGRPSAATCARAPRA